jgi:transposase
MPRYKPVDRSPRFLPVVLSEQIVPGSFEFTLDHLVDHELDFSELDARFKNDETGASAYDPRVMLKIVLLGYCRGLTSSRSIERACQQNVQFMAISGDSAPSYTHIAKFVRELAPQIQPLFKQVLMTCDRLELIGREMFAIDGVKLPANASKERSGTHEELTHRARRLDKAAAKILELHRLQDQSTQPEPLDARRQAQIEAIAREAQRTREFVASTPKRKNRKGQEVKANVTDNDSAKMATSKGVIQGYAAQAAVDAMHQVIVAADVLGSGSEQLALLPMIEQAAPVREADTLMTADAGYHSNENIEALRAKGVAALIADNQMRKRDERFAEQARHKAAPDPLYDKRANTDQPIKLFRPQDFEYDPLTNTCRCPAGKTLYSNGSNCTTQGRVHHKFTGSVSNCVPCDLRDRCLRHPERTKVRQVAFFAKGQPSPHEATELMKRAIDSPKGRQLYSQRIGTVEPVFANIRHNKRMNRFTLRGLAKVNTQWHLFCLVHNIEKIAGAQRRGCR